MKSKIEIQTRSKSQQQQQNNNKNNNEKIEQCYIKKQNKQLSHFVVVKYQRSALLIYFDVFLNLKLFSLAQNLRLI